MEWHFLEKEISLLIGQYYITKTKSGSVQLQSTSISFIYSILPARKCKVAIPCESSYFMEVKVKNCMSNEVHQKTEDHTQIKEVLRSSTRSVTRSLCKPINTDSTKMIPNFVKDREKLAENQKTQKKIVNNLLSRKSNSPHVNNENLNQKLIISKFESRKSYSPQVINEIQTPKIIIPELQKLNSPKIPNEIQTPKIRIPELQKKNSPKIISEIQTPKIIVPELNILNSPQILEIMNFSLLIEFKLELLLIF